MKGGIVGNILHNPLAVDIGVYCFYRYTVRH